MIYKVKAKIIPAKMAEFYHKLTDGTIAAQKPDGNEIIASMKRAVISSAGTAEWYEMCFCNPPLQHERSTQYDFYFSDMSTMPAEDYGTISGDSLWDYMAKSAAAQAQQQQ
jgi:hypothetical protein